MTGQVRCITRRWQEVDLLSTEWMHDWYLLLMVNRYIQGQTSKQAQCDYKENYKYNEFGWVFKIFIQINKNIKFLILYIRHRVNQPTAVIRRIPFSSLDGYTWPFPFTRNFLMTVVHLL